MSFRDSINPVKNLFFRFWKNEDPKISLIRDVFVAFLIVLVIVSALWAYTGQWLGSPMVAIESGSMMHNDEPFGRLGTIDAGDMVLLVKVNTKEDVLPRGSDIKGPFASKSPGDYHYGEYGDVVVYRPYGDPDRDQIIHRAMCWVEYHEEYGTYTVEEYGIYNETSLGGSSLVGNRKIKEDLGLSNYRPSNSGFITKGDNPNTNPTCDQEGGICTDPIKVEWISGKARCELPWIGTINLFFNDIFSQKNTLANVPGDSKFCLIVLIVVLISIPVTLDLNTHFKSKKQKPINVDSNPEKIDEDSLLKK